MNHLPLPNVFAFFAIVGTTTAAESNTAEINLFIFK